MKCVSKECDKRMKCVESRGKRISNVDPLISGKKIRTERKYVCECGCVAYTQEYLASMIKAKVKGDKKK